MSMKTIGLLGGMSWESTESYYRIINEGIKNKLGGLHSARITMVSVDFSEIEKLQHQDDWGATATLLTEAACSVEAGGAEGLLICTNTMHRVAPQIEQSISIPILHIADATAKRLQKDGVSKVGLLGTRFTMEQDFYKGRLVNQFGMEVLTPNETDRELVHRVIYSELCLGRTEPDSRRAYLHIINQLHACGAEAIILGCTEIALLIQQEHTNIPLYDTSRIHAEAAVEWAISE